MEEAWELAVVSSRSFADWSGRHTRLRYQSVLSSLVFALAALMGVKSFELPGFIKFKDTLPDSIIMIGLLSFSVFSLVSFRFQHLIENRNEPNFSSDLIRVINRLNDGISDTEYGVGNKMKKANELVSDNFDNYNVKDRTDRLRNAREFFKHWQTLETDLSLILAAKEDISRVSPGALSFGNSFVRNVEWYQNTCVSVEKNFRDLIDTGSRRSWDSQKFVEIQFSLKRLENESSNISKDIDSLSEDLKGYSRNRYVHSSMLSYELPISLSVIFIGVGILQIFFNVLEMFI